jgi:hypothetical protein
MNLRQKPALILAIIVAFILAVFLIWRFVIEPLSRVVSQHPLETVVAALLLICIAAYVLYDFGFKRHESLKEENDKLIALLYSKGFERFKDRLNNVRWGTAEEVKSWEVENQMQLELNRICNEIVTHISAMPLTQVYKDENSYEKEMNGWLKSKYPQSLVQQSIIENGTVRGRVDIAIDDIAIEIKGPTDKGQLDTLSEKCIKYAPPYKRIIFVLCEPKYHEADFNRITGALKNLYGDLVVFVEKKRSIVDEVNSSIR